MRKRLLAVLALASALLPAVALASHHRSPLVIPTLWKEEARLTDLYAFPDGDRLVMVLGFFRNVDTTKTYDFKELEFAIHMDLTTKVTYDNEGDRVRYGGTIPQPGFIKPTASVRIQLSDDGKLKQQEIKGLKNEKDIKIFVGLRDDPFIFPTFNGKNVMALVVSVPFSSFPKEQKDWLIWGVTNYGYTRENQIALTGRALRTVEERMQRFDTLPPSLHVEWLKTQRTWSYQEPGGVRSYDYAPDVMIFTTRRKAGFPNGRLLTDDVVAKVCEVSDCGAYERSVITGGWPRSTVNDVPFLKEFPYLAPPHKVSPVAKSAKGM